MDLSRRQVAGFCLIYALVMTYSSTIIGPSGMNFVWRPPGEAFHALLHVRFIPHGSDQRADWMGNLMMLVPFGLLMAAWVPGRRLLAWPATFAICFLTICGIKYLQLFFPPRTVTLNYITAQSLGALTGIGLYGLWRTSFVQRRRDDPAEVIVALLRIYLLALIVFLLEPLDFALNVPDLVGQILRLPATIAAFPGADRPAFVRMLVVGASVAAFVPVGVLLAFVRTSDRWSPSRATRWVAARGMGLTIGIYAASCFVMGAYPVIGSVLYRGLGVVLGAVTFRWLLRRDPEALRAWLARLVPWLVGPYLLAVLAASRLLSTHWLTPDQAMAQLYKLGLIPLFDYYIVPKAAAAKNIVGHALMYMPVGIMVWLRAPRRNSATVAAMSAALLAACLEAARYLRPGLEGDINAILVAGISAWVAARALPVLLALLADMTRLHRVAR